MNYEYATANYAGNWHESKAFLNIMGAEGWALVGAMMSGGTSVFIFMRPVPI